VRQTWCSTRTVQPVKLSLIIYPFSPPLLHHSNTVSTAVVHMNTFFSTFNPLLRRAPALPLPRSLVLAAISVRGRPYRLCSLLPPCVLFFGAIAGNRCKSIVYAFFFLNSRSCFNPIPPSTAFQPDPHLICLRKRERKRPTRRLFSPGSRGLHFFLVRRRHGENLDPSVGDGGAAKMRDPSAT